MRKTENSVPFRQQNRKPQHKHSMDRPTMLLRGSSARPVPLLTGGLCRTGGHGFSNDWLRARSKKRIAAISSNSNVYTQYFAWSSMRGCGRGCACGSACGQRWAVAVFPQRFPVISLPFSPFSFFHFSPLPLLSAPYLHLHAHANAQTCASYFAFVRLYCTFF